MKLDTTLESTRNEISRILREAESYFELWQFTLAKQEIESLMSPDVSECVINNAINDLHAIQRHQVAA